MSKRKRWTLSKEEILSAADKLARKTGFDFSMRDLGDALETWPNSIYVFYETKSVLQAALLDDILERVLTEELVGQFLDKDRPWQSRIKTLGLHLFDVLSDYEGAGHMMTHYGLTGSIAGARLFQMFIHFGASLGLTSERTANVMQVSLTLLVALSDLAASKKNGSANPQLFEESPLPSHPDQSIQRAADRILNTPIRERAVISIDLMTRAIEFEILESEGEQKRL